MVDSSNPRIELYVRSLLPDGAQTRQEAVIERLERGEPTALERRSRTAHLRSD